jgi:ABC-2 type transport system ATP-binding protein
MVRMTLPALSIDRVTKRFATVTAVDDVTFSVGRGELLALLGPNGAGKSTLLRMIVGIFRPDAGEVVRHLTGALGYLPEDRGLHQDVPVLRVLTYFGVLHGMSRRDATDAATRWLERLDLGARANETVKSLSKGNQQKVQFVAAVLHRPPLVLLDEPFSGLDPVNQDVFVRCIGELRADGSTVLFSAHQMPLVERLADRLILVRRGRVALEGTPAELRRRWGAGERLVLGVPGDGDVSMLERHEAVAGVERSDGEVRLRLREGAALAPLLRDIGTALDVRSIRTDAVSLHEIYVRTVEEPDEARAEVTS